MQQIQLGYRGLALLFDLTLDRFLWPGVIAIALVGTAYLGAG